MLDRSVRAIVSVFGERLMVIVERAVHVRSRELAREAMANSARQGSKTSGRRAGQPSPARGGRPPGKKRKQLCPVPGCDNVAAPIFGMACREHKDLPVALLKKYRAERRGDFSHLTDSPPEPTTPTP